MKVISKEEEQAHYNQVLKGGAIGGSVGFALGLAGVLGASRRYPGFRSLTLPFRTFLVSSATTAGAIITAERYSINFHRAQDPRNFYKDTSERAKEIRWAQESNGAKFVEWARQNRYSLVGASWVAAMGVALALVSRNKYLTTSQKLVQARVYAQGLAVAVMLAAAGFEAADAKAGKGRWETVMVLDPNDPEHKHMIEKRVHKEEYEGQDLWMGKSTPIFALERSDVSVANWFPDMVAAEERRLNSQKQNKDPKKEAEKAEAKTAPLAAPNATS